MAAGDVDMAAELVQELAVPARRQGRVTTLVRWFRWLDDRDAIARYPMVTALAALIYAWMGRPAEAARWAGAVDRWDQGNPVRPDRGAIEAWAALVRAFACQHGIAQMRIDADQAVRRFHEAGIVTGAAALLQGIARITSGDLDGGDAALADAARLGQQAGTDGIAAEAMAVRSLAAMARGDWIRAEDLAGQARATLHLAAEEDSYIAPLVCAAEARAAIHRGDVEAARRQLVSAQRARPLLTYAIPHVAVQARIELTRAHLALGDTAGARTLLREIDDLLRRCPQLGTLVAEAEELRARIGAERGPPRSRSLLPDGRRTAHPAAAGHPPVLPRDRRRVVRLAEHRQVTGVLDIPQARRLLPQRGGRPVQATGAARRVNPTGAIALDEFS